MVLFCKKKYYFLDPNKFNTVNLNEDYVIFFYNDYYFGFLPLEAKWKLQNLVNIEKLHNILPCKINTHTCFF